MNFPPTHVHSNKVFTLCSSEQKTPSRINRIKYRLSKKKMAEKKFEQDALKRAILLIWDIEM